MERNKARQRVGIVREERCVQRGWCWWALVTKGRGDSFSGSHGLPSMTLKAIPSLSRALPTQMEGVYPCADLPNC